MLTNSKIALALALVLAPVSTTVAAPNRASRHQTTIEQQVTAGSHLGLNSVRFTRLVPSTGGTANQSSNISPLEYEGLARLIEAIDEIGIKENLGN